MTTPSVRARSDVAASGPQESKHGASKANPEQGPPGPDPMALGELLGAATASLETNDEAVTEASETLVAALDQGVAERFEALNPAARKAVLSSAFGPKADGLDLTGVPEPTVRLVDAGTLDGASGAYESRTGVIYLNRELLADRRALFATYVEEFGHHIDAVLGGGDAAGDEGELFRLGLSAGDVISPVALSCALGDDDHGTIAVDGRRATVEFADLSTGPGSQDPFLQELERLEPIDPFLPTNPFDIQHINDVDALDPTTPALFDEPSAPVPGTDVVENFNPLGLNFSADLQRQLAAAHAREVAAQTQQLGDAYGAFNAATTSGADPSAARQALGVAILRAQNSSVANDPNVADFIAQGTRRFRETSPYSQAIRSDIQFHLDQVAALQRDGRTSTPEYEAHWRGLETALAEATTQTESGAAFVDPSYVTSARTVAEHEPPRAINERRALGRLPEAAAPIIEHFGTLQGGASQYWLGDAASNRQVRVVDSAGAAKAILLPDGHGGVVEYNVSGLLDEQIREMIRGSEFRHAWTLDRSQTGYNSFADAQGRPQVTYNNVLVERGEGPNATIPTTPATTIPIDGSGPVTINIEHEALLTDLNIVVTNIDNEILRLETQYANRPYGGWGDAIEGVAGVDSQQGLAQRIAELEEAKLAISAEADFIAQSLADGDTGGLQASAEVIDSQIVRAGLAAQNAQDVTNAAVETGREAHHATVSAGVTSFNDLLAGTSAAFVGGVVGKYTLNPPLAIGSAAATNAAANRAFDPVERALLQSLGLSSDYIDAIQPSVEADVVTGALNGLGVIAPPGVNSVLWGTTAGLAAEILGAAADGRTVTPGDIVFSATLDSALGMIGADAPATIPDRTGASSGTTAPRSQLDGLRLDGVGHAPASGGDVTPPRMDAATTTTGAAAAMPAPVLRTPVPNPPPLFRNDPLVPDPPPADLAMIEARAAQRLAEAFQAEADATGLSVGEVMSRALDETQGFRTADAFSNDALDQALQDLGLSDQQYQQLLAEATPPPSGPIVYRTNAESGITRQQIFGALAEDPATAQFPWNVHDQRLPGHDAARRLVQDYRDGLMGADELALAQTEQAVFLVDRQNAATGENRTQIFGDRIIGDAGAVPIDTEMVLRQLGPEVTRLELNHFHPLRHYRTNGLSQGDLVGLGQMRAQADEIGRPDLEIAVSSTDMLTGQETLATIRPGSDYIEVTVRNAAGGVLPRETIVGDAVYDTRKLVPHGARNIFIYENPLSTLVNDFEMGRETGSYGPLLSGVQPGTPKLLADDYTPGGRAAEAYRQAQPAAGDPDTTVTMSTMGDPDQPLLPPGDGDIGALAPPVGIGTVGPTTFGVDAGVAPFDPAAGIGNPPAAATTLRDALGATGAPLALDLVPPARPGEPVYRVPGTALTQEMLEAALGGDVTFSFPDTPPAIWPSGAPRDGASVGSPHFATQSPAPLFDPNAPSIGPMGTELFGPTDAPDPFELTPAGPAPEPGPTVVPGPDLLPTPRTGQAQLGVYPEPGVFAGTRDAQLTDAQTDLLVHRVMTSGDGVQLFDPDDFQYGDPVFVPVPETGLRFEDVGLGVFGMTREAVSRGVGALTHAVDAVTPAPRLNRPLGADTPALQPADAFDAAPGQQTVDVSASDVSRFASALDAITAGFDARAGVRFNPSSVGGAGIDAAVSIGTVRVLVRERENLIQAFQRGDADRVRSILGEAVMIAEEVDDGRPLRGVERGSGQSPLPTSFNSYLQFTPKDLVDNGNFEPLDAAAGANGQGGYRLVGRAPTMSEQATGRNVLGQPIQPDDLVLQHDMTVSAFAFQGGVGPVFLHSEFGASDLAARGFSNTIKAGAVLPRSMVDQFDDYLIGTNWRNWSVPGRPVDSWKIDIDFPRSEVQGFRRGQDPVETLLMRANNIEDPAWLHTGELGDARTTIFRINMPAHFADLGRFSVNTSFVVKPRSDEVTTTTRLTDHGAAGERGTLTVDDPRRVAAFDDGFVPQTQRVNEGEGGLSLAGFRTDGESRFVPLPDRLLAVIEGAPMEGGEAASFNTYLSLYEGTGNAKVDGAIGQLRQTLAEAGGPGYVLSSDQRKALVDFLRLVAEQDVRPRIEDLDLGDGPTSGGLGGPVVASAALGALFPHGENDEAHDTSANGRAAPAAATAALREVVQSLDAFDGDHRQLAGQLAKAGVGLEQATGFIDNGIGTYTVVLAPREGVEAQREVTSLGTILYRDGRGQITGTVSYNELTGNGFYTTFDADGEPTMRPVADLSPHERAVLGLDGSGPTPPTWLLSPTPAAEVPSAATAPVGTQELLSALATERAAAEASGDRQLGSVLLASTQLLADAAAELGIEAIESDQIAAYRNGSDVASFGQMLQMVTDGDLAAWGAVAADLGRTIQLAGGSSEAAATGGSAVATLGSALRVLGQTSNNPGLALAGLAFGTVGDVLVASRDARPSAPVFDDHGRPLVDADGRAVDALPGFATTSAALKGAGGIMSYLGAQNHNAFLALGGTALSQGVDMFQAYATANANTGQMALDYQNMGNAAAAALAGQALQTLVGGDAGRYLGAAGSVASSIYSMSSGQVNPAVGGIQMLRTGLSALGVQLPGEVNMGLNLASTIAVGGPMAWAAFGAGLLMNAFRMGSFYETHTIQEDLDADADGEFDDDALLRQEFRRGFFGDVSFENHRILYDVDGVNPKLLQNVDFAFRPEMVATRIKREEDSDDRYTYSELVINGETLRGHIVDENGESVDEDGRIDGPGDSEPYAEGMRFVEDRRLYDEDDGRHSDDGGGRSYDVSRESEGTNDDKVYFFEVKYHTGNYHLDLEASYDPINPSVDGETVEHSVLLSRAEMEEYRAQLLGDAAIPPPLPTIHDWSDGDHEGDGSLTWNGETVKRDILADSRELYARTGYGVIEIDGERVHVRRIEGGDPTPPDALRPPPPMSGTLDGDHPLLDEDASLTLPVPIYDMEDSNLNGGGSIYRQGQRIDSVDILDDYRALYQATGYGVAEIRGEEIWVRNMTQSNPTPPPEVGRQSLAGILDDLTVRFRSDKNNPNLYQYMDLDVNGTPDRVRVGLQMDGLKEEGDGKVEVTLLDEEMQPVAPSYTTDDFVEAEEIGALYSLLLQAGASDPSLLDSGRDAASIYREARSQGQLDRLKALHDASNAVLPAILAGDQAQMEQAIAAVATASAAMPLAFDPATYATIHEDVAVMAGGVKDAQGQWESVELVKVTQHYLDHGNSERRAIDEAGTVLPVYRPNADGWTEAEALGYLARHQDLIDAYGADPAAAKAHWDAHGRWEERPRDFDVEALLATRPDLAAAAAAAPLQVIDIFDSNQNGEGSTIVDGLELEADVISSRGEWAAHGFGEVVLEDGRRVFGRRAEGHGEAPDHIRQASRDHDALTRFIEERRAAPAV